MDADGYPEDDELDKISEWPYTDCAGLLEYARSLWRYPEYWNVAEDLHKVSTGGWSGNESIIGAMMKNRMFWQLAWQSSRRGGHYEFVIPPREFRYIRAAMELNK